MTKFKALLFKFLPHGACYGFFETATGGLAKAGGDVKAERLQVMLESFSQSPTLNSQFSILNS